MTSVDREALAAGARKILAEGSWPEVVAVRVIAHLRQEPSPEEEFEKVRGAFEKASCPNIVSFLELIRFKERQHNIAIQMVKLLLNPRGLNPDNPEDFMRGLEQKDILAGSMSGKQNTLQWMAVFADASTSALPEQVQIMDKIFGEALVILSDDPKGHA